MIIITIIISIIIILKIGFNLLYGSQLTLHCGNSNHATTEGEWFLNGFTLRVYSRSYTITNATFKDDGEYQCRRNGTHAISSPLQVYVHGKPQILSHTHNHHVHIGAKGPVFCL